MNTWHCPCSKPRMSCIHKYVAKWHLFETQRHLFRKVWSTERTSETTEQEPLPENRGITYPPEDDRLKKMVSYIYSSKKYPSVLPDDVLSVRNEDCPMQLIPLETVCSACPGNIVLGPPVVITSQAQIVSLTGVLKGKLKSFVNLFFSITYSPTINRLTPHSSPFRSQHLLQRVWPMWDALQIPGV